MDRQSFCEGRYGDLVLLNRGHYSDVYDASDRRVGCRVAIKLLRLTDTHRDVAAEMVRREVEALEGFEHPAIVRLLGQFEEDDGRLRGIVLELIPGGRTLEALIKSVQADHEPHRPLRWCVEQLGDLLDGIDHAHQRRVIHRDIKPGNILLQADEDRLRLADFGVALLLENFGREGGRTLQEFYTRPWAAPEQVLRRGGASPATDLYAFGLLAASLLTWQLPPDGLERDQLSSFLEPLREEIRDPALYQEVQRTLVDLLHPQPEMRPRVSVVARLLQFLLERTTDRTPIPITLTNRARDGAARAGLPRNDHKIIADLTAGLRVRYDEESPREGQPPGFLLRFWGKTLWGMAKPSSPGGEELIVVDAGANPPAIHERQKEDEVLAPFELRVGAGSGLGLITFAYQTHLKRRREEEARRKKESLFQLAEQILKKERERLACIMVRYEIRPERRASPQGRLGQKLQAAGIVPAAEAESGAVPEQHQARPGDLLKLRVLSAAIPLDQRGYATDLGPYWYEFLDQQSKFLVDDRQVARMHHYEPSTKTLTVEITSPCKLPHRGVLEYRDVGTETSLDRQETALGLLYRDGCVNPRLGHLLLFPEENALGERRPRQLLQRLEPAEFVRDTVERAVAAEDFFFLQGPPGTGKTTLIAEIAAQLLLERPQCRILIASQANEAVDNAIQALRKLSLEHAPHWRIARYHDNAKDQEGVGFEVGFREWVGQVRARSAAALAVHEETPAPVEGDEVRSSLARWQERLDKLQDVREDYASTVQVFGATCIKAPRLDRLLRELRFDRVIVDEAAKATPTEVLVSLSFGRRFILVGDHKQLPPYLDAKTEDELRAAGLDVNRAHRSLFQDLFERVPKPNRETLRRQFRMHHSIGTLVGDLYYQDVGGLENGVPDEQRPLELSLLNRAHRVFWIDVPGQETKEENTWWNRAEIDFVKRLLDRFEKELRDKGLYYSCGVISPYLAQRERLESRLVPGGKQWSYLDLQVATVDAFQGKEKDVIVYSMVRTGEGEKRWISDPRRLNVAFSRAKRLLVIVGHKDSALQSSGVARVLRAIPQENILRPEGLQ